MIASDATWSLWPLADALPHFIAGAAYLAAHPEESCVMIDLRSIHRRWLAAQVRVGTELVVAAAVRARGYEEFLPMYVRGFRRTCGNRINQTALFPGYLFVRFDLSNPHSLVAVPGLKRLVGTRHHPTPVSDDEVEALRVATSSGRQCAPWGLATAGQRVEIKIGALAGVRGIVVRVKNKYRLVISVELIRKSVLVELDSQDVVITADPVLRAA